MNLSGVSSAESSPCRSRKSAPGTWPATKVFLKLCARALDPDLDDVEPFWLYVYRLNLATRDIGKRLHLRVPRQYQKLDRFAVLAGVAGVSNDVPYRKQAFDWARR